jgi:3-dehydroquinate dehydratase
MGGPAGARRRLPAEQPPGVLVDWIHDLRTAAGLVIKAAAYTHTSVAIRDAPVNVPGPVVEVQVNVQSVVACP